MTLVEFLLARIAEDEEKARAAESVHGADWRDEQGMVTSDVARTDVGYWDMYADTGYAFWDCEGASSLAATPEASAMFARWDPSRVLAECDAKRRIIEWVTNAQRYAAEGHPGAFDPEDAQALTHALRLLGLPYADHPDYREEWR